jgi:hypothetical protein
MKTVNLNTMHLVLALIAGCAASASGANPQMGGAMKHLGVELHGGTMLHVHVDNTVPTPEFADYGETYAAPADVLNGMMYNAQYGWMVEGFWTPPSGATLWIEQIAATPGLRAYSGGTMMNQGTFDPIFGTDGSSPRIAWSGAMLHNWYAVDASGVYQATYSVYFGDASGNPLAGYMPAEVTIDWYAQSDCIADFVDDGVLDFFDVQAFLAAFSVHAPQADVIADGVFDFFDVQAFLSSFSQGCP